MKYYLKILSFLIIMPCFGQGNIDNLVQLAMDYHDIGEYETAIGIYHEALRIDPKSTLVNYELAMTYVYLGNYEKAIKHSDIVIKQKKDNVLLAHITKGSALSNLGKTKQAIKTFNDAIKKFGDNYLVYFNLGITYFNTHDNKNAETAFINAITNNPNHNSSHITLAFTEMRLNNRVQAILSLYYFLLLEPSSARSETAYFLLKEQLVGSVQKDEHDPNKINIMIDSQTFDSEFGTAELMLAMLEATNSIEENKNKTPEELFIENTKSFFMMLGELRENNKKENIWWNFYIPFFYELAKSEYIDVFCHYISISSNNNAVEWLKTNDDKFENFINWITEK